MANRLVDVVLARYPHVNGADLSFPPESDEWGEEDLDIFIGSGGVHKPHGKINELGEQVLEGLPPLGESPWWVNNASETARVRLFCVMGIGNVASSYGSWVSQDIAKAYPNIEICVVELPGHGTNFGAPLSSIEAAAEALAEQIRQCHCAADGTLRPYALFGFSMGANIVYLLAQKLGGCLKLYLSGRAPPHVPAPARDALAPEVEKLDAMVCERDVIGISDVLVEELLPVFMAPAQIESYGRILQSRLGREDGRRDILRFAGSLVADCKIGMEANHIPREFSGDIHFYYSSADETWPLEEFGLYDDVSELWKEYTSGRYMAEEVESVSHDVLGGSKSPVFGIICRDLEQMLRDGRF